jgi:SNF2 family DNA or RNA helicase
MKDTVRRILKEHSGGLTLYSIYIKTRFQISIDSLSRLLNDKKQFIHKDGRYISRDIEKASASISFYVKYYPTKDIIILHSQANRVSDGKEIASEALPDKTRFIITPKGITESGRLPREVLNLLLQVNTIIPSLDFPEFMLRTIPQIERWGEVKRDETVSKLDIKDRSITPTFYIDYDRNGSWIYFYPKYFVGEELTDISEVEALKSGEFIRKNLSWRRVGFGDREAHQTIIKQLGLMDDGEGESTRRYRLENFKFTSIEELEHNRDLRFVYSEKASDFINGLKDFNSIAEVRLPDALSRALAKEGITLRGYQRVGVNWLSYLRKAGLNGLVADDMGLGKTIQVIATMASAYEELKADDSKVKPSLVVCPKSVVGVWKEQLSRFYPGIRTGEVLGRRCLDDYLKSATSTNRIILLTTYETISYRKDAFLSYDYLYVILDEAQKIKNPQTRMAKTIKMLNASHKLAMTGTPIENHLSELWSIFDFIMRGYLGSHETFKAKFKKPISEGNNAVAKLLKMRIEPFKIRRTKMQKDASGRSIIQLPELINDDIKIELSREESKLYRKIVNSKEAVELRKRLEGGEKSGSLSMNIFAILTRLKQLCDHPSLLPDDLFPDASLKDKMHSEKFATLLEKVEEIIDSEQKVVIFSQYREMLAVMEGYLSRSRIGYSILVGGMSSKQREAGIHRFQNDPENKTPVFLASLKAGGVGISLTSASNVIHYDRWWNPAVENQATDRVYRSGNASLIVNVYRLMAKNTIEEKIDSIMKRKQALMENIIREDDIALSKTFTREELISLLSG